MMRAHRQRQGIRAGTSTARRTAFSRADIPGAQAMLEAHLRSTINYVYPPGQRELTPWPSLRYARDGIRADLRNAANRVLPIVALETRRQDHYREFGPRRPARRIPLYRRSVGLRARPRRCGWRRGSIKPTRGKVNFDGQPMRHPAPRESPSCFKTTAKALLPWRNAAGKCVTGAGRRPGCRPPSALPASRNCCARWACPATPANIRLKCRVACSSACRSRALPGTGTQDALDGRAVRRAGRDDAAGLAGRGAGTGGR